MIGIEELEKQLLNNYKEAVIQIIVNNTSVLVDEDISSLLKKPPLDSMDAIKCKLLTLAKKEKIIIDTEAVNTLLEKYRKKMLENFSLIAENRVAKLMKIASNFEVAKESDIIKFPKKEFNDINKKVKKIAKENLQIGMDYFISNLSNIFLEETDEVKKESIKVAMSKYFKSNYNKELIENIDVKLLVKDTTLINSILEQGERYLFTKTNSHLHNNLNDY